MQVLERIAAQLSDDVIVVAPEHDQSGVSHSLSLNDPLRLRKISERRFAVKGHADGLRHHGRARNFADTGCPISILSGVNRGSNVADDVTYSGTIAGGDGRDDPRHSLHRSVAMLRARQRPRGIRWDCAEIHAPDLIKRVLAEGIDRTVSSTSIFPIVLRAK